ncbi:VUT family protein [Microvirga sp. VF16]|uniref:VUT family protein n=1 Tax=Microvirga sp. VF16 TaxID=2807101 RepID=UPI00193D1CE2|nr:VUT family protein [Microvirga sp. VF16]QRM32311.1 VUT family protein [Microvirga sp. VF16]
MNLEARRRIEGLAVFVGFTACIPAANWMIGHVGRVCVLDGPCLIPVAPDLAAPSGVLVVGLALVLRDLVQRRLGRYWALAAIGLGAVLSAAFAPPALVLASIAAFLLSELTDLAVYTPLQQRGLILAVMASSVIGPVIDSIVFLAPAFGSLQFLLPQVLGKAWMVLLSIPAMSWLRQRDERIRMPVRMRWVCASASVSHAAAFPHRLLAEASTP